jgi:hypothetical protein
MSNKAPSFFKLATQPKWIGALLLALIVAAIFGALGQWQLDRTFTKDDPKTNTGNSSLAVVHKQLYLDTKNTFIIDGRVQNGTTGYWLLMNATDENQVSTTLALGWVAKLDAAEKLRTNFMEMVQAEAFLDIAGYPLPTEGPQPADSAKPYLLKSVALGQLINLYSPDAPIASSPEYLALAAESVKFIDGSIEPIQVTYRDAERINWLSAFYFLEWLLFAGFAIFLWWRLVRDEQIRLAAEAASDKR